MAPRGSIPILSSCASSSPSTASRPSGQVEAKRRQDARPARSTTRLHHHVDPLLARGTCGTTWYSRLNKLDVHIALDIGLQQPERVAVENLEAVRLSEAVNLM
jgi:hypothetical protein